jgi:hypothetical protein
LSAIRKAAAIREAGGQSSIPATTDKAPAQAPSLKVPAPSFSVPSQNVDVAASLASNSLGHVQTIIEQQNTISKLQFEKDQLLIRIQQLESLVFELKVILARQKSAAGNSTLLKELEDVFQTAPKDDVDENADFHTKTMFEGEDDGHGKKRPREKSQQLEPTDEQDKDENLMLHFQLLINLLKHLSDVLRASQGSGTPAIHMYSILDQVAALHDDFSRIEHLVTMLREVDIELLCILQHCKDDHKRKQVRFMSSSIPVPRPQLIVYYFCFCFCFCFDFYLAGHRPPNLWQRLSQLALASFQFGRPRQKKSALAS